MSVLLLIFYNFTGIYLHIRQRRQAKTRETAAEKARETIQARQRWKTAKQIAKRNIARLTTQISRTISHQRISISHDEPTEEPGTLLSHPRELSDASAFTTNKENTAYLSDNFEIQEDIENNNKNNENRGKETAPKKKNHRHTRTQIFQNAYIEIEKEKAFQQENKHMTFSDVFTQATKEKTMKRTLLEVTFKDLTLTLGKKKLLGSITGKLIPGKVTAVMGPSGAGKTTFLNAVAGKVIAGCKVSGSVLVNGKVGNIRSYKKIIGFVPQDDIVHGDLTVEENLWFSARCRYRKEKNIYIKE
jgi:ABC-type multidrug transport system fused ATPase/permease subunit